MKKEKGGAIAKEIMSTTPQQMAKPIPQGGESISIG